MAASDWPSCWTGRSVQIRPRSHRAEALRGTYDIGYGSYSLGKLQILKLRKDYEAQEGSAFSLKKFHDAMLKHGMPPIRLLREIMLKDKAKWDEVL